MIQYREQQMAVIALIHKTTTYVHNNCIILILLAVSWKLIVFCCNSVNKRCKMLCNYAEVSIIYWTKMGHTRFELYEHKESVFWNNINPIFILFSINPTMSGWEGVQISHGTLKMGTKIPNTLIILWLLEIINFKICLI